MATGVVLFDTRRRRLRQKKRRPREQETANDGQRRFHVITMTVFVYVRSTSSESYPSIFCIFVGLADFLDVFGRVFIESAFAASTAKFDLLPLIHEN